MITACLIASFVFMVIAALTSLVSEECKTTFVILPFYFLALAIILHLIQA